MGKFLFNSMQFYENQSINGFHEVFIITPQSFQNFEIAWISSEKSYKIIYLFPGPANVCTSTSPALLLHPTSGPALRTGASQQQRHLGPGSVNQHRNQHRGATSHQTDGTLPQSRPVATRVNSDTRRPPRIKSSTHKGNNS